MKLPLYKKIAYGMGRFGSSAMLTLTGLTSFLVYGTIFELNWILAGISLATSYVVIGLTHWLTGYISDGFNSRFGRRKPFVMVGAPGLAITGYLLFIPDRFFDIAASGIEMQVFLYYLFFLSSFKFFYAFLLTAFQAWLPEITDEDERPLVSSMQNTANWIANGLGVTFGFITPLLFVGTPQVLSSMGQTIIAIFSLFIIIFYLPSILLIKEKPDIVIPPRSLYDETAIVLKNKTFVGWFMTVGFLSFTFSAITAQIVGFAQIALGLNTIGQVLPPALALLVSIMVFLFIWIKSIKRFGKKKTMMFSLVYLAILLPLTPLIPQLATFMSNVNAAILFFIPLAAGMAVYYIMSYIVPADIAEVDEIVTGHSRAGMYTGFIGVPLNLFQAAGSLLLGFLMDYSRNVMGGDVWGYLWWGPLFAPFLLVAAFILRYIDIDPDIQKLREGPGITGVEEAEL